MIITASAVVLIYRLGLKRDFLKKSKWCPRRFYIKLKEDEVVSAVFIRPHQEDMKLVKNPLSAHFEDQKQVSEKCVLEVS